MLFLQDEDVAAQASRQWIVRRLIAVWVLGIMTPSFLIVYFYSGGHWLWSLAGGLAPFLWALCQGSVLVYTFRWFFGDSPLPVVPLHGVVLVKPDDDHNNNNNNNIDDFVGECLDVSEFAYLERAAQLPPIRLLVMGDSLSIGVGQTQTGTPVLPVALAKTLSRKMGGRLVYWTCHGGTGASVGWIVRELRRGVPARKQQQQQQPEEQQLPEEQTTTTTSSTTVSEPDEKRNSKLAQVPSSSLLSEMDDSSSDESATKAGTSNDNNTNNNDTTTNNNKTGSSVILGLDDSSSWTLERATAALASWREKLRQHATLFHPHLNGYYDIAVVTTGMNDLKSAVFPFLLTGDDAEFRRQAQERGGSFFTDIKLLVDTLTEQMNAPNNTTTTTTVNGTSDTTTANGTVTPPSVLDTTGKKKSPMIFFPRLGGRVLPIFQHLPERWLAVPFMDVLNTHLRKAERTLRNQVFVVPSPNQAIGTDYASRRGPLWHERETEQVVLSLHDAPPAQAQKIARQLQAYYRRKGAVDAHMNNPFKAIRTKLLGVPPPVHLHMFSPDGIHPCEPGYDLFGRLMGNAIYEAWRLREDQHTEKQPQEQPQQQLDDRAEGIHAVKDKTV